MIQLVIGFIILGLGAYVFTYFPFKKDTKKLTQAALFVLLALLCDRLSIMIPLFGAESLKIGFGLLPLMISGMIFSPSYCFLIGLSVDLGGLLINPTGFPFLGFTLSTILQAVMPSLFLEYTKTKDEAFYQKAIATFIGGLLLFIIIYVLSLHTITIGKQSMIASPLLKGVGLSIVGILVAILFFFIKRQEKKNNRHAKQFYQWIFVVLLVEVSITFLLTPCWLDIMYGIPFTLSLFIRVIKACIIIPLDCIIGISILKILSRG